MAAALLKVACIDLDSSALLTKALNVLLPIAISAPALLLKIASFQIPCRPTDAFCPMISLFAFVHVPAALYNAVLADPSIRTMPTALLLNVF
ncbi:hypothetical protein D3C87_1959870 [compost metagenome]